MAIDISIAYDMLALVLFENSKLFRDIAQFRSVSRGASQNGISQSAASQHLHELERKLGISVLDRTTRPLTLTPAGKLYFELCRDVLRREEEFQAALDELKSQVEGAVRQGPGGAPVGHAPAHLADARGPLPLLRQAPAVQDHPPRQE